MRYRLIALILVPLLLLTGCGQLPRPFAHEAPTNNQLLDLKDSAGSAGITVLPIAGDPPGAPNDVAEAMAEALRRLNIPASVNGGNRKSQRLEARAVVLPAAGDGEEVLLYWDLRTADGGRAGIHAQRYELPRGAWRTGDTFIIGRLIADTAPVIAAMVPGIKVGEVATPNTALPEMAPSKSAPSIVSALFPTLFPAKTPKWRLVILPLDPAPGDAALSLPRALEAELRAAKLPIADKIGSDNSGQDDLLVLGDVELGPPENGVQEVAITWRLVSVGENKDLGEVAQHNRVPAGSLDGPWGATARDVAKAAVAGVIDLLGQAGKL